MKDRTALRKLILLSVFAAIAYLIVSLVRIPVVLFLKYEPKDVIITVAGFLLGPLSSLIISAVAIGIFALITEKKQLLPNLKAGFWLYLICGLANGLANFFVVFLSLRVAASVMFPVISAGGIVLTFLVSLFFYKEKLSKWQILGSALGLMSVIFLNM